MEKIITIENFGVSYDGKIVLDHINASFQRGKITALIGHSGCGKSTLLSSINKLISLQSNTKTWGDIFLDGQNIKNIPDAELRRRIGMVFQSPSPFPMSIWKNMTYAPIFYGIKDKKALKEIVAKNLQIVGLYDEVANDLHKNALKLSGGQQQRLCIARALTAQPEVLLLDEPCSALDAVNTRLIENLLLELKKDYTIIIVTHDLVEASKIADDCVFISNGTVVESGPFKTLLTSPQKKETAEYLSNVIL